MNKNSFPAVPKLKLVTYKILKISCIGIIFAIILFFFLNILFPLKINIKYSQIVTASDGTIIHSFLSADEKWRMKTDVNEISPQLKKAILFKEDNWFYYHIGVNPVSVIRAAVNNILHRQRTSGASTITMQLARLLYPKNRTYLNKVAEMFRALQLEYKYPKEEILRMYLTLVPYGGNIEGIKAASLLYFGRMPDKLSIAQIATLAIIPNRPNSFTPGKNNDLLIQSRNKWLRKMSNAKLFSLNDIADALSEPIQAFRLSAPSEAPQFSLRMHDIFPALPVIHTSLNRNNQQKISAIASNYSKRMQSLNIHNAAVFVINNKTRRVEAYVGSSDVNDDVHNGQVDGVMAIRSPGSTLKPLLYAIAFDKGLVTPKSVLTDVPVNFDGYAPENFNTKFNGSVTVEKALSNSLNIPAVKILNDLGVATFTDKLKQLSFRQIAKDEQKLGLSCILGGCGVTLEEITRMFSMIAHQGKYTSSRWLMDSSTVIETPVISPASAYMISDILCTLTRPDLPNNYQSSMHVPKIAWKTGTSYGRRDAWSIGYNMDYTVGVWLGNFSGEGVPELSGADIASPLMFEVFNSIDYNSGNKWFTQPADLDFRLVCSRSGKVPDDFCNDQIIDYYIPGISSSQKCTHEKRVYVSPDETFSYCTTCLPASGYKMKLYPDIDQDLLSYYENEHLAYVKIPPHNRNCSRVFTSRPPVITSPVNNKEYLIDKNDDQKLMLYCNPDNEVKTIFWYINDRFYKSCSPSEKIFFTPIEGKIKISCSDDKGRNSNIVININYL